MEFLLPYMANRPRVTNANPIPDRLDFQESENSTSHEEIDLTNDSNEINCSAQYKHLDNNLENNAKKRKPNDSITKFLEDQKKARDNRSTERDFLRRQILKQQEEKNALKSFFDAMYEMSKTLPEHAQMKIQREVFNSVMQAREENTPTSNRVIYSVSGGTPFRLPFPTTHATSRPGSTYSIYSPQSHSVPSPQSPNSMPFPVTSPPPTSTAISNTPENLTEVYLSDENTCHYTN